MKIGGWSFGAAAAGEPTPRSRTVPESSHPSPSIPLPFRVEGIQNTAPDKMRGMTVVLSVPNAKAQRRQVAKRTIEVSQSDADVLGAFEPKQTPVVTERYSKLRQKKAGITPFYALLRFTAQARRQPGGAGNIRKTSGGCGGYLRVCAAACAFLRVINLFLVLGLMRGAADIRQSNRAKAGESSGSSGIARSKKPGSPRSLAFARFAGEGQRPVDGKCEAENQTKE